MKKITLLVALLITAIIYSQNTVVWNNRADFFQPGGDQPFVEAGQTITMNITFNTPDALADSYMEIELRELDATFATVFQDNVGQIFPPGVAGVTTETTIDVQFTVPSGTTPSADLDAEHFWYHILYIDLRNGEFPNVNADFTVVPAGTLSIKDFSKETISSFIYPNPTTGIVNIGSEVVSDNIKVYDVAGNLVVQQQESTVLNISDQADGLYF